MTNIILTAAAKGTIVLAAAWIATALLRRNSADLRHRIWLAALVAMALLLAPVPVPQTVRFAIDAGAMAPGTVRAAAPSMRVLPVVWSVICALLLLRWGSGVWRLARITRRSRAAGAVRISDSIHTPMTWGAIRPVILLPAYVEDWAAQQRDVVIRHERAHIERRDWLWQAFAQAMTAVFWFHPLVWLAAARLREEAEHAADDRTLAGGVEAPEYADRLMAVARQLSGRSPEAAVAMVRRPALTSRIAAILESGRMRTGASRRARILVILLAAGLLVPLGAFQNRPVYHSGVDGVMAPSIVYKTTPSYDPGAKAEKIQGVVTITCIVNTEGHTENIQVAQSLDPRLDANAVASLSQWLFKPGTKDGQPVDVAVTIAINFKLL